MAEPERPDLVISCRRARERFFPAVISLFACFRLVALFELRKRRHQGGDVILRTHFCNT